MNAHLSSMDLATKILIVDDDQGIRTLVASFLEKHGFQAEVAGDPAEMRSKLQNSRYDLIVLDVMMPGEDGLTALRRLQQDGGPPVIMLSAVGTDIDKVVGVEVGAEEFMGARCKHRAPLGRTRTGLRRNEARASDQRHVSKPESGAVWLTFAGWKMDVMSRVLHDPQ